MYKTDPIKFIMMIAIIYLVLRSFNVIESFKPSNVSTDIDLQALSTVSQFAQKWQKAVDIDAAGNVTFKEDVKQSFEELGKDIYTDISDIAANVEALNEESLSSLKEDVQSIGNRVKTLLEKDLTQAESALTADTEKNNEFRIKWPRGDLGSPPADSEQFMLIEFLSGQVEQIQKDLQNMMNNAVNIERLQKDMEKVLADVEKLKDKIRSVKVENGHKIGE